MLLAERKKSIKDMTGEERTLLIKEIQEKHIYEINNPKINKDDDFYNENMILLVHQKSNWHLYYDPKNNFINSIAVIPSAKSSSFGNVSYFKRWYKYMKRNSKNTMLCLSEKAVELLQE